MLLGLGACWPQLPGLGRGGTSGERLLRPAFPISQLLPGLPITSPVYTSPSLGAASLGKSLPPQAKFQPARLSTQEIKFKVDVEFTHNRGNGGRSLLQLLQVQRLLGRGTGPGISGWG